MNVLQEIKNRFAQPLEEWSQQPDGLLAMIRPAQDKRFGDYQANCAMPLSKQLGKPPQEVAAELIGRVQLDDFCQSVEVAGPGFINLTLDDQWLAGQLTQSMADERLGVDRATQTKTFVIDFSSPNVAKPMHVGHIRSTVIGDSLARILRFLGHRVITDNHLGDWGTQFGMIIYGYKHFLNEAAYIEDPVTELGRLYRVVRQIMDYQQAVVDLPKTEQLLANQQTQLAELEATPPSAEKAAAKRRKKDIKNLTGKIRDTREKIEQLQSTLQSVNADPSLQQLADQHADIGDAVLQETAKLHEGDETNVQLWQEFLPHCREDIQRVYQRLDVEFDHQLGESFYQDQLADVVSDLQSSRLARESEGAICVFLDEHDAPMIIRKSDGAFLYATTDLATIKYRMEHWQPDCILYVVDFRQHEHFSKLFEVGRRWKYPNVDYRHISFGTVMGDDGKPFRTRAGDTVGLEPLLDESERRALQVVSQVDDEKPDGPEFSDEQRREIARVVGIGALKYADLSQNRSSDYTFSYDKMLELKGNTATYLQYGYARVNGIFRRGNIDPETLRANPVPMQFEHDVERELAVQLLRLEEVLAEVIVDFRPNLLASYLFELTQTFFVFFDKCPVLKAKDDLKSSRLQFCDLTARTIRLGLQLLGIQVIPKM